MSGGPAALARWLDGPGNASPDATKEQDEVRAAARGDQIASERVLKRLLPRVRSLLGYLMPGDAELDDVTQECLIQILVSLRNYREDGSIEAFANRIVLRVAFTAIRQRKARRLVALPKDDLADRAPPLDHVAANRRTFAMLSTLPPDQRHALILHFMLEMTVPEVSHFLDIPEETVRTRLRRGKARMIELYGRGNR